MNWKFPSVLKVCERVRMDERELCLWVLLFLGLLPLEQAHRAPLLQLKAGGPAYQHFQAFTGPEFTFQGRASHFPLPLWITEHHLSLQVLLERICINYYSSALNMVTAPVGSPVYFVTTFSALLSNRGFFFSPSQENNFSLWPAAENKPPLPPLPSPEHAILISLPGKFCPYK